MDSKPLVDRSHAPSLVPKLVFSGLHFVILLFCAWLVYGDGLTVLGKDWFFTDLFRAKILLGCAVIYWLRHVLTLFYLLQRRVDWGEVFGLLGFFALFEIGLLLVGGGIFRTFPVALGGLDVLAALVFVFGSYLNSYSEIQRKWWKAHPENKGHCYTGGLFQHSMHINFFGDVVLFSGWALFTANLWMLGLPVLMMGMFIFMHIPALDRYLAGRYGVEFQDYARRTKKLIPFIY